ncbi:MAG: YebC/PmpR family DNA-binding transcriptional regulator [Phycisphaerales bacterium]
MAGHSKWHNIKHRKAAVDKKRGKAWTKCAKAIMVAAKMGGPDPDSNLTLRYAIDEARYANMPRDTIERAVKKGAGLLGTDHFESVRYEGYGPGGVAVIVDALTDNRTRTAGDLRLIFGKYNGNLGTSGSVAFMFECKGRIAIDGMQPVATNANNPASRKGLDEILPVEEDRLMELAIAAGAADVVPPDSGDTLWTVYTSPTDFHAVKSALESGGMHIAEAAIDMIPTASTTLTGDAASTMIQLVDALEDNDDVQKVYANFEVPEDELARMD